MPRPDRRENDQIRALHSILGLLNRVDGSAQFSAGSTSVYCGVYGPVDVKVYDEKLDRAVVEVKFRPAAGVSGTKDRWVESAVRGTFEREILAQMHPRTLIQINIQAREDDGSADAAAINATTMALVDAGVPLRDMVAAASCAVLADGAAVVDPTLEEAAAAQSVHTFAFAGSDIGRAGSGGASGSTSPVYVDSRGDFSVADYDRCYDLCLRSAQRVLAFMRTAIEGKIAKESQISVV
ncbi:ribosomal protein S5 domain 2-type protein [Coemansia spiralis]|nr:ribosomal protein S5 domain 2-type protein [Coemansia spiralis]